MRKNEAVKVYMYIICSVAKWNPILFMVDRNIIMNPHTEPKGRGHIAFGADPVAVGVCVASCLLSKWVDFDQLAQTNYWEEGQKWLDLVSLTSFSRSHQHFEISNFDRKSLCAPYLLNQMTDSGHTSYMCIL